MNLVTPEQIERTKTILNHLGLDIPVTVEGESEDQIVHFGEDRFSIVGGKVSSDITLLNQTFPGKGDGFHVIEWEYDAGTRETPPELSEKTVGEAWTYEAALRILLHRLFEERIEEAFYESGYRFDEF